MSYVVPYLPGFFRGMRPYSHNAFQYALFFIYQEEHCPIKAEPFMRGQGGKYYVQYLIKIERRPDRIGDFIK